MAREIRDTVEGGYAPHRESAKVPQYEGFIARQGQFGYNPVSLHIPQARDSGVLNVFDRAGGKLENLAVKIQQAQDDARVEEALVDLRRHATDLEAGENGWRKLLQNNALEPDSEGKGLVERIDTDMRQYGQSIGEKLTERQRSKFNRHALNVYQSVYGGVSHHVATQGMEYQKGVYVSAIDSDIEAASVNGYRVDLLNDAHKRIITNTDKLADLLGIPQNQRENLQRKNLSAIYTNAINGVMSQADTNPAVAGYALGMLNKNAKHMLGSDVNRLRRNINSALAEVAIRNDRDKLAQVDTPRATMHNGAEVEKILKTNGSTIGADTDSRATEIYAVGVLQGLGILQTDVSEVNHDGENFSPRSRYGASNVSLENAYGIDKNVDPKRLLDDKAYNTEVGRRVFAKYLKDFAGDEQQALAAYFSTPDEVRAAQKAATESEDGTGNWFDKLPSSVQEKVSKATKTLDTYYDKGFKDANGRVMSSFEPQSWRNSERWMTAEEMDQFLLANDPRARTDPSHRDRALSQMLSDQNKRKAAFRQEQENLMAKISDALYSNGGDPSAIPNSVWGLLTRKQQKDVLAVAKKIQAGEDVTNIAVSALYADDNNLSTITMEGLRSLRPLYSSRDYAALEGRWLKLQSQGRTQQESLQLAQNMSQIGVELEQYAPKSSFVEDALSEIKVVQDLKKKDKVAYDNLVAQTISFVTLKGQGEGNGPITSKGAVRTAVQGMYNVLNGANPDKIKSLFQSKASELPNKGFTDVYTISKELAKSRYGHAPSDQEIINTARDITFNRWSVNNLQNIQLDEGVLHKAREDFKAVRGRYPQGGEVMQAYFRTRFSGEIPESRIGWSEFDVDGF